MTLAAPASPKYETPLKTGAEAGPRGELAWVPVHALRIDDAYQRPVNDNGKANIRRIAENFRWSRFSPLIVARRPGKLFAVIDGQHRAVAVILRGDIEAVPCFILACAVEEEAAAFAVINGNVTRVPTQHMFRARLAAGDPRAVAAERAAQAGGARILPYPVASRLLKPGETLASGTIEDCTARFGEDVVAAALALITRSGDNTGLVRASIVAGLCDALHANAKWLRRIDDGAAAIARRGLPKMWTESQRKAAEKGGTVRNHFGVLATAVLRTALGDGAAARPAKTLPQQSREKARSHHRAFAVAPPKDRVSPGERGAIDAFIAAKGARKVEPGATGDRYYLLGWLQRRGIEIVFCGRSGSELRWRLGGKKIIGPKAFDALVDAQRVKEGLQPLRATGGTA